MDNPTRREFLKLLGKGAGVAVAPKGPLVDLLTKRASGVDFADTIPIDPTSVRALEEVIMDRLVAARGTDRTGVILQGLKELAARDDHEQLQSRPEAAFGADLVNLRKNEGRLQDGPEDAETLGLLLDQYYGDQAYIAEMESAGNLNEFDFDEAGIDGSKELNDEIFTEYEDRIHNRNIRRTGQSNVEQLQEQLNVHFQNPESFDPNKTDLQNRTRVNHEIFKELQNEDPFRKSQNDFNSPEALKQRQSELAEQVQNVLGILPQGRIAKGVFGLGKQLFKRFMKQKPAQKPVKATQTEKKADTLQIEHQPQEALNEIKPTKPAEKVAVRNPNEDIPF